MPKPGPSEWSFFCARVPRNDQGKLLYDVQLRAPEDRRKRLQSFADVAAKSWGTCASSVLKPLRIGKMGSGCSTRGDGGSCCSSSSPIDDVGDTEVQPPLKESDVYQNV